MDEENGDKNGIARQFLNIGNVYSMQKDYSTALDYFFKALKINEELGYKNLVANCLGNIGNVYADQTNYPKSLEYYFRALRIAKEIGDNNMIAVYISNIGSSLTEQKKFIDAYNYLYIALAITDSIGAMNEVKDQYYKLSNLYERSNIALKDTIGGKFLSMEQMRLRAMYYYKRAISIRDTLFSEENKKQLVRKEMNFEFEKRQAADSVKNAEQAKLKDVQTQAKLQQERTQRYVLYSGITLLLVFGSFMFNRFRVTQKQKVIIEQKNILVEEKQKEIVDSINYAKRIQYTLLAHEQLLKENLNEYFVMFKPKDIVSGDFYWATKKEDRFYLACCDSTGHGVPGAFMSLLNISFLNEAIIEKNIINPNEVLDHTRKRLIENVSQNGGQDGMDAILVCFEKNRITYAAANNAPILIHNGELMNLSYDKMPVGKGENMVPFKLHTIDVQKGDSIYLYTDGYADQFGGAKGKKFKYKQLEEKLLEICSVPCNNQKDILMRTFNEWKGNLEQVDDVCIIGINM